MILLLPHHLNVIETNFDANSSLSPKNLLVTVEHKMHRFLNCHRSSHPQASENHPLENFLMMQQPPSSIDFNLML